MNGEYNSSVVRFREGDKTFDDVEGIVSILRVLVNNYTSD